MKLERKIGNLIKELRQKNNLSQEKLALNSNIDRTYIQSIEKGERNISIKILKKITLALNISISEFFKKIDE